MECADESIGLWAIAKLLKMCQFYFVPFQVMPEAQLTQWCAEQVRTSMSVINIPNRLSANLVKDFLIRVTKFSTLR